jgi:MFS family permease
LRLPASLEVLRQREFRLLYVGQTISLVGDGMLLVALPFAVFALGGSATTVGFVFAAGQAPLAAVILAGGVVGDRLPRRALMLAADLVRMAVMGLSAALLLTGEAHVWELIALQAGYGTAAGFFYPASTGLLPTLVEPELLQPANGLRGISQAAGQLVGPAIAGVIVASASPGWAIAVDAATFAASAVSLSLLRPPAQPPQKRRPFFRDLHDGWREFTARTWVWASVALAGGLASLLFAARQVLGPEVARTELGGAGAWAAITASAGAGAVIGGIIALHVRPRRPLVLMALSWLALPVTPALLSIPAPTAVLAATSLVAGIGLALGLSLWDSALGRHIPPESLSRVSAYDWFGSLVAGPLAMSVVGPLADAVGTGTVLIATSALFLAGDLLLASLPSLRAVN